MKGNTNIRITRSLESSSVVFSVLYSVPSPFVFFLLFVLSQNSRWESPGDVATLADVGCTS